MEMSLKLPSRELFHLCPQAWESLWFVIMKVTRLRRDRLLKSDGFGQAFCCPLHLSESTPLQTGGGGEQGDHHSRGNFSEREKRSKHALSSEAIWRQKWAGHPSWELIATAPKHPLWWDPDVWATCSWRACSHLSSPQRDKWLLFQ